MRLPLNNIHFVGLSAEQLLDPVKYGLSKQYEITVFKDECSNHIPAAIKRSYHAENLVYNQLLPIT